VQGEAETACEENERECKGKLQGYEEHIRGTTIVIPFIHVDDTFITTMTTVLLYQESTNPKPIPYK
jgi:hypothetical protein